MPRRRRRAKARRVSDGVVEGCIDGARKYDPGIHLNCTSSSSPLTIYGALHQLGALLRHNIRLSVGSKQRG